MPAEPKAEKPSSSLASGDILCDLLQALEIRDVLGGVAGILKQLLVVDDAVGLDNVRDTLDLAVVTLERVVVLGELTHDVGVIEVVAVILHEARPTGPFTWKSVGASDFAISDFSVVSYWPEAAVFTVTERPSPRYTARRAPATAHPARA